MNSDDEALRLEVLKRRLAGTVRDALKSDAELEAELRGELLARAELRGRERKLSSTSATPALAAAQASAPTAKPEAPAGQAKRWTPERLAELKAYRATHTAKATAAHFGIHESRIRKLLPSGKPRPSPFPGVAHRAK